ncbi:phosphodiesterase [Reyranella sp. CPCC 100927]|uniref:phosphodiesterase n=1 Tax=Reyranella sp. CPCC 100927 TaxID=2599616 RepID=UPI0011B79F89|nr:phosphodiesterase [Reyranella sp. CPCC 100927]TWT03215.1 phosphodiesterase [Reyranella sp. CPCC 100927]
MLLAQISDLHVRPRGQLYKGVVDSNRLLQDAISHLHGLDPRPDLVLVTGDLVDEGDPAEYAMLRTLLAPCETPYLLIPGNHDSRDALRDAFAEHSYLPARGRPLHYVNDAHPVRIVALDTTVPGSHHGAIDDTGLAWLADTLARERTQPTVIIMHHPPFASGIPYLDDYMLRDAVRLEEIVARFDNIERVLCGHVHRPIQVRWAGTIVCTCPSTATQIALRLRPDAAPASYREPPACLLHRWQPGSAMITHTSYIGHFDGPYPFA